MIDVTARDRFWAQVNRELAPFLRVWEVLELIKGIDAELHGRLLESERWMLRPERTIEELCEGWAWYFQIFRKAVALIALEEQRSVDNG